MKKLLMSIALCSAVALSTAFAADGKSSPSPADKASRIAAARERRALSLSAGRLPRKGTMKGKIAFIDTQTRMSESEIRKVMSSLTREHLFNFVYEKAKFTPDCLSLKKSSAATIAIVIVDDSNLAPTLVSPDEGWAMMNVAGLEAGLVSEAAKAKFMDSRRRKQLMRVYGMVAGGWKSNYPGNIASVNKVSDLDLADEQQPVDVIDRNMKHFKANGISPMLFAAYGKACMEGWAPAPTNDAQKAIWDKVHAIPTKPIKILPETKPVKE